MPFLCLYPRGGAASVRLFGGVVTTTLGISMRRMSGALSLLSKKTAVPFVDQCQGRTAKKLSRMRVNRVGSEGSGLYRLTGQGRAVLSAVRRRNGLARRLHGHVRRD